MTTAERILKLIELKNIKINELAKMLNIPSATMYSHFYKKNKDHLSQYLPQLSELFPDISKRWLYFGEGEIFDKALNHISLEEIKNFKNSIEIYQKQLELMLSEIKILKEQAELLEYKINNL